MHTRTLKKLFLALSFWLALHMPALKAQLVGPYGTSPLTFGVDSNALLYATGTYGTGTLSLSGAGTRMFWYPGKAAFRAGYVSGTQWNDANIGAYSIAFGSSTTSSGSASTAFGNNTTASGNYAVAFGSSTHATGDKSLAAGYYSMASGAYSVAMGQAVASGTASVALGEATATGYSSVALGEATASGTYAVAAGNWSATAAAYDSFVVGAYNNNGGVSSPSHTTWVATDPLFEVGNGTSSTAKSDALVVYKNGVVAVHNVVRVNAGGDLSMGSFTAGTAP
jgi:hypothetical protein